MLTQVENKIQELNEQQRLEYRKRKQDYLEEIGMKGDGKNKSNPVKPLGHPHNKKTCVGNVPTDAGLFFCD